MSLYTKIENTEGSKKLFTVTVSWFYTVFFCFIIALGTLYIFRSLEFEATEAYATMICRERDLSGPKFIRRNRNFYCPPATNIFFLKTHKCASSTVQNILMRYGDKKNLTFALPKSENYFGYPQKFSRSLVVESRIQFNILCHHLRLDVTEVGSALPDDTVYVTVVRDPVDLFASMYDYYQLQNYTGHSLQEFASNTEAMSKLSSSRHYGKLGRNQMLFDMGYESNVWENETLILDAIKEMNDFFDLVMVFEQFEESMILFKDKLCWSMEDITYLVHNKRKLKETSAEDRNMTLKIREYNKADQMLYDFFKAKLEQSIDEYGRVRMAEQVKDLKLWNRLWFQHCVEEMSSKVDAVSDANKAYSSKVYSFVLKNEPISSFCKQLATEELQYTKKLRLKQRKMFRKR